jgi:peptidyl-prolyl cis-trans isomerase C
MRRRLVPLSLFCAGLALADTAPLARVGSLEIDAPTFRARAARVAELDWSELGATWPEQRRRFLDEVLIPEALLSLAAEKGPPALPPARDRALCDALTAALMTEAARVTPSDAELRAEQTRLESELSTPRALSLWRILLPTEADARALIAELATPTVAAFSRLARERSIDHATHMRAGNLGQVGADGQTRVPELRVSPALFAAADQAKDGELVREPVREGEAFAVVWRRASQPEQRVSLAASASLIQARLAEQRAAAARGTLLETLRRERVTDYHPERLAGYEARFPEPARLTRRPASAPAAGTAPARFLPELTDRGLR